VSHPQFDKNPSGRGLGFLFTALAVLGISAILSIAFPGPARSQAPSGSIDTTSAAGDGDAQEPKRKLVKWNQYDGPVTTARLGYGLGIDYVGYSQDDESKKQFRLTPELGLRDFRILLKGKFKTKRDITWCLGYMYDGAQESWFFRQTGVQVQVPEVSGSFFVGRTKEGYSAVKVMTGYYIWNVERSQSLDAFVPILGDGIKYMGYFKKPRIYLNLGFYGDAISEDEKFAIYDHQFIPRLVWQPILSEDHNKVLHIGIMGRDAKPDNDALRLKSKPGAFHAPTFLDTGSIPADHATGEGAEVWYRSGSWMVGSEYNWEQVSALNGDHPTFRGGNSSVTWIPTGETRPYNVKGAYFDSVSPKKSVFEGGHGAVELILDMTYNDFDDGIYQGGKFWRLTPMAYWHMADILHLGFAYGYGKLDRFGTTGTTQFFQFRFLTYY
jgi:phosphate-selective porin OprO/OprP